MAIISWPLFDGRKTIPKGFVLHTAGAEVTTVKMGLWKRLLDFLIDPNLISLMLSLGVLGLVVELWHPGLIFPATFGILCLAIAFFGLDVLPVNWAGLVLIAAAFAFWIAELFVVFSHGALTVAGAACFVFGSLLLFQPAGSGYQVSLGVPLAIALTFSLFFAFVLAKVDPGPAPAGVGRPADDRRHARAGRAETGSSRCGASSGRHATRRASRSQPAKRSRCSTSTEWGSSSARPVRRAGTRIPT